MLDLTNIKILSIYSLNYKKGGYISKYNIFWYIVINHMKKYSKKVLAASSVITVLANNITIANASELITSNDEFNKSVLLENHQSTGKKIYVKQINE